MLGADGAVLAAGPPGRTDARLPEPEAKSVALGVVLEILTSFQVDDDSDANVVAAVNVLVFR